MYAHKNTQRGFSLLELMITVVIVGILATIAMPAYNNYVIHAHREEGLVALNDTVARLERYYSQNNTYSTATFALLGITNTTTQNGYYQLAPLVLNATTYTVKVNPLGAQLANDTDCGSLSIDNTGVTTATGSAPDTSVCFK